MRLHQPLALATLAALAVMTPATAANAADGQVQVLSHTTLSHDDLVAAANNAVTSTAAQQAKTDFLNDQARAGVLWDASQVSAAAIGDTTAAWSNNISVDSVETAVVSQADGHQTSEIQAVGSPDGTGDSVTGFRAGSDALQHVSGQVSGSYAGGALTVSNNGDKLTSAWERYRVAESKTDRNVFYYGHWATAVGKVIDNAPDHYPGTIDIRSRPTSGHRSDFLQMRNYWPKAGESYCSTSSASVGILGFSATLPLGNCSSITPDPDASNIVMRNTWDDGNCRDSRAEYDDLGMAVDIQPGIGPALLSDYSYARFEDALCDQVTSNDTRVIYADPGW